jgi:Sodium/hydrogen exchanger family
MTILGPRTTAHPEATIAAAVALAERSKNPTVQSALDALVFAIRVDEPEVFAPEAACEFVPFHHGGGGVSFMFCLHHMNPFEVNRQSDCAVAFCPPGHVYIFGARIANLRQAFNDAKQRGYGAVYLTGGDITLGYRLGFQREGQGHTIAKLVRVRNPNKRAVTHILFETEVTDFDTLHNLIMRTPLPHWRTGRLIGWAGTRGIVTVVTALALPQNFPERGMLLFAAFTVTLGTLLVQGLTLRPLVLALHLDDVDPINRRGAGGASNYRRRGSRGDQQRDG